MVAAMDRTLDRWRGGLQRRRVRDSPAASANVGANRTQTGTAQAGSPEEDLQPPPDQVANREAAPQDPEHRQHLGAQAHQSHRQPSSSPGVGETLSSGNDRQCYWRRGELRLQRQSRIRAEQIRPEYRVSRDRADARLQDTSHLCPAACTSQRRSRGGHVDRESRPAQSKFNVRAADTRTMRQRGPECSQQQSGLRGWGFCAGRGVLRQKPP